MTLLYTDPRFLDHQTGSHPERPERLRKIVERLAESGLGAKCVPAASEPISLARLARVHAPDYVAAVERFVAAGGGQIEADTVVSPGSLTAALLAAGAVSDAVRRVVRGEDQTALCLVRPPGHHALPAATMGFCLFNNVAVGAKMALAEEQLDRVLIVDWDVHHGNGTQAMFYEDPQVGFFSSHRWPFYPGTGDAAETGRGPGLATTCNLPIAYGTPRAEFLGQFVRELSDFAARIQPQLVLISAGFDAHRLDPIGSLELETEDFATLTQAVQQIAAVYAGGRIVSVLEGGYHVAALADSVQVHLQELLKQSSSEP
ncbi:MAG TPA: histone deacetylase [Pirellulales bacterium]|jgi:acetoin utilization deacetylase AcuC-like enzyme|nr:histone deacetylase [Pirellulales bacterium]